MRDIRTYSGTLTELVRLDSSLNGNPRYQFRIGDESAITAVDSSLGYAVGNYDGMDVEATVGNHYGSATLIDIKLLTVKRNQEMIYAHYYANTLYISTSNCPTPSSCTSQYNWVCKREARRIAKQLNATPWNF